MVLLMLRMPASSASVLDRRSTVSCAASASLRRSYDLSPRMPIRPRPSAPGQRLALHAADRRKERKGRKSMDTVASSTEHRSRSPKPAAGPARRPGRCAWCSGSGRRPSSTSCSRSTSTLQAPTTAGAVKQRHVCTRRAREVDDAEALTVLASEEKWCLVTARRPARARPRGASGTAIGKLAVYEPLIDRGRHQVPGPATSRPAQRPAADAQGMRSKCSCGSWARRRSSRRRCR